MDATTFVNNCQANEARVRRIIFKFGFYNQADDFVSEIQMRAWRMREKFDAAKGTFRVWYSVIARSTLMDYLRVQKRRPATVRLGFEPSVRDEEKLPATVSMAGMSPRSQEILGLKLRGYSLRQISIILEMNPGTVRSCLYTQLKQRRSA
jgi:RNA polymerase sigma-70 factor (ECF subfamily)